MPTSQFNGFLRKVELAVYYKYALFLYTTLYCFVTGNFHYLPNFKFSWPVTKKICEGLNVPVPKQHKINLEMFKDIVFGKFLVSVAVCGINYSHTDFHLTVDARARPIFCTFAGQYLPYFIYQPLPLMTSFFSYLCTHGARMLARARAHTHTYSFTSGSLQGATSQSPSPQQNKAKL